MLRLPDRLLESAALPASCCMLPIQVLAVIWHVVSPLFIQVMHQTAHMLIFLPCRLAEATGTFAPVSPILLEMLQWSELSEPQTVIHRCYYNALLSPSDATD